MYSVFGQLDSIDGKGIRGLGRRIALSNEMKYNAIWKSNTLVYEG